ncbi:alpha-ribazole phosphatase [Crassaminicella profunda]|uniref:alpha-ribazole phosphatase n=1 Tax=Crassaminicella profunda TaxID=1286698 RepID=UPI001CA708C7|nr:alpha-ribazole phosphatase [Crassaminicella profunda]QZY57373.1 alpha-ribazole phosphatase [Crassaminicella profunda]
MKLIFVRHGETIHNHKGLYCGWNDLDLTEKGMMQAKKVCEKLKEENLNLIITSDLNRTIKTAEIINVDHHINIILEKNLREMNFGLWEGLSYKEIKEKYVKELNGWESDWIDYILPSGESVRQMYERVTAVMDKIIHQYKNENILIVSHAGCIRAILAYLIGNGIDDYWKYKVENCGITTIEMVDDFPVLNGLNQ